MEDSLFDIIMVALAVLSVAVSSAKSMKKQRERRRMHAPEREAPTESDRWEPLPGLPFPSVRPTEFETMPEAVSEAVSEPFAGGIEEDHAAQHGTTSHDEAPAQPPCGEAEREALQARNEAFDLRQAVIWSEILAPKFDEP